METYVFEGLSPAPLFRYFYDICQIPHGSGNEEAIADYLVAFAAEHDLFCVRDALNNVFIRKPAAKGYEDKDPIILQGHTDMVCEQNLAAGGAVHNFLTDPLALRYDAATDIISATGTTLGADDGTAVAIMLALLADRGAKHPTLECLFTVSEEIGLEGAKGFDCSLLTGSRMLNLDSESEGIGTAGCAGGARISLTKEMSYAPVDPDVHKQLILDISGLAGGHSGADIHLGRQNAIRLMARLLSYLYDLRPFMLLSVTGGSADNAIPRECAAKLITDRPEQMAEAARTFFATVKKELAVKEDKKGAKFRTAIKSAQSVGGKAYAFADTAALISAMFVPPIGPLSYMRSGAAEGLVESSANLGVIRGEGEMVELTYSLRSNVESKLDALIRRYHWTARTLGFDCREYNRYPGWQYAEQSALAATYAKAYGTLHPDRAPAVITVIHAGLECGILSEKVRNLPAPLSRELDILSIGPDIHDIHTPDEHMTAATFARTYAMVRYLLENLE